MPVEKITLSSYNLLTVEEVAAKHKRTTRSVLNWIADGKLPALKVPSRGTHVYLIPRKAAEEFTPVPRGRLQKLQS